MRSTGSSNDEAEYPSLQISYTTADIENNLFFGETPNPLYFIMPEPLAKMPSAVFTVIDGELREIKNEAPPGARLPSSRLLEFAGTSFLQFLLNSLVCDVRGK